MATIDKLPSGLYRARVRRQGQRMQTRSFRARVNAEAWARKVESEQERGTWQDTGDAGIMTLSDALAKYIDNPKTKRHRGYRAEQSVVAILQDEPLGSSPLTAIDSSAVSAMSESWLTAGLAAGTVNRRLAILSAVYSTARDEWGMPGLSNPVRLVEDYAERSRRVTDSEIDAICEATGSRVLPVAVKLAVESAMRRGELCAMTWSMIRDLGNDAPFIRLPPSVTKNKRGREVPLSTAAVDVLKSLPPGKLKDRVLGTRPDGLTQAFMRAASRARTRYETKCEAESTEPSDSYLIDLRLHDLRHEATYRLATTYGYQMHDLMRITGHRSAAMLQRYYNDDGAGLSRTMRKREDAQGVIARLLDAITGVEGMPSKRAWTRIIKLATQVEQ